MLSGERLSRANRLFEQLVDLDSKDQGVILDVACGDDPEVRAFVLDLLANAATDLSGFLRPIGDRTLAQEIYANESLPEADGTSEFIGSYRVVSELGAGGQGTVYLAEDLRLHRKVALKLMPAAFRLSHQARERFRREATAASKLNHPGICTIYEIGEHDGMPFIAMQYVDGESLDKRIRSDRAVVAEIPTAAEEEDSIKDASTRRIGRDSTHRFSEMTKPDATPTSQSRRRTRVETRETITPGRVAETVEYFEEAARVLHAAHQAGLVHRDIKPGNLMAAADGRAMILDFGLAHDADSELSLTQTGDFMGTPAYMSPEQLAGDHRLIDRRTDLWSLGVTLYECLTLQHPFPATTREQLFLDIKNVEPRDPRRLNASVSRDLRVVLETTLAKNPDRRYQTALDLAEDLERVRTRRPIRARPLGPLTRSLRWALRNPELATASVLVFSMLLVGFVWTAVKNRELLATNQKLTETSAAERRQYQRFAQLKDSGLAALLDRQAVFDLWPRRPSLVPTLDRWLAAARDLLARGPELERALKLLEATQDLSPEESIRRRELARVVSALPRMKHLESEVAARRAFALRIEDLCIKEHATAWQECIEDLQRDGRFAGHVIVPRVPLVPLGKNLSTGYWEFWHTGTGERPDRPGPERHAPRSDQGLTMVLLPGGQVRLGAQTDQEAEPHFDELAMPREAPVHTVELTPFFIATTEMTQRQWMIAAENNPSFYQPDPKHPHYVEGLRHPVEAISWFDCQEVLPRLELSLPTEAQWEYACRGGQGTPWSTGALKKSLRGAANLADQSAEEGKSHWPTIEPWLRDGYVFSAPVGSYRANDFGLFDTHGNVAEWCLDPYVGYEVQGEPGTGERRSSQPKNYRMFRGGFFGGDAADCRSSRRQYHDPSFKNHNIGVRPTMPLPPRP